MKGSRTSQLSTVRSRLGRVQSLENRHLRHIADEAVVDGVEIGLWEKINDGLGEYDDIVWECVRKGLGR